MSVKAVKWVMGLATVPPPARVLLFVLAEYTGKDGSCWPSTATLIQDTGLSRTRFFMWKTWLVNHGYLATSGATFRLLVTVPKTGLAPVPKTGLRQSRKRDSNSPENGTMDSPENGTLQSRKRDFRRRDTTKTIEPLTEPLFPAEEKSAGQNSETKKRERDNFFDALVHVLKMDPSVGRNGGRIGKLKKVLLAASPPYTPEEVLEFGKQFARSHPYVQTPTPAQVEAGIGSVRKLYDPAKREEPLLETVPDDIGEDIPF